MISDFQFREFGFGSACDDLSDADPKRINDFRLDEAYMDKDSAKFLQNGSTLNKYLSREDNPFVVLVQYAKFYNKQGYWSYDHLVIQMEECLDRLKVLYLSFDLVFVFDHFCGHNQAREGRPKISITRKYFGGKQQNMRDTVILGEDRFLGPHDHILATDNTQHMWWDLALPDIQLTGPFWISDMENSEHRHDMFTKKTTPAS